MTEEMDLKRAAAQAAPLRVGIVLGWQLAAAVIEATVAEGDVKLAELGEMGPILYPEAFRSLAVVRSISGILNTGVDGLDEKYGVTEEEKVVIAKFAAVSKAGVREQMRVAIAAQVGGA